MTAYVALLRAINVGGANAVAMAELRAMCGELGLGDARTVLQSGNVVFRTAIARAELEPLLEREAANRFGTTIEFVVRSADEWSALIAANPFTREAADDPAHVVVMCCKRAPEAAALAALTGAIAGREDVRAAGADVYITYPDGIGDSKLTNAVIQRKLGTSGTARNWNTVRKIAALLAD
jgi:uncharacterized protein (DUF1697 family)